jgi:hypothetical protein
MLSDLIHGVNNPFFVFWLIGCTLHLAGFILNIMNLPNTKVIYTVNYITGYHNKII